MIIELSSNYSDFRNIMFIITYFYRINNLINLLNDMANPQEFHAAYPITGRAQHIVKTKL
jgi:hypothetical protein